MPGCFFIALKNEKTRQEFRGLKFLETIRCVGRKTFIVKMSLWRRDFGWNNPVWTKTSETTWSQIYRNMKRILVSEVTCFADPTTSTPQSWTTNAAGIWRNDTTQSYNRFRPVWTGSEDDNKRSRNLRKRHNSKLRPVWTGSDWLGQSTSAAETNTEETPLCCFQWS